MIHNTKGAVFPRLLQHFPILPLIAFAIWCALSNASAWSIGGRSFSSDNTFASSLRLQPLRNLLFSPLNNSSPLFRATKAQSQDTDTTVHEWGTFTSIAGPDGLAMDWLPLTGSTDLPSFVEHLKNADFKGGLRGTVRMETPVLYFYSLRETDVFVHASFSKGLITEWYPHASVPSLDLRRDISLDQKRTEGAITWNSVHIQPSAPARPPESPASELSRVPIEPNRSFSAEGIDCMLLSSPQRNYQPDGVMDVLEAERASGPYCFTCIFRPVDSRDIFPTHLFPFVTNERHSANSSRP